MRAGKNDPLESVQSIMEKFIAQMDYSKVEKVESCNEAWKNVVPKSFETKTRALNKTSDGKLFVACENSLVTSELFMIKEEIIAKIPENLEIKDIVFTHKAWKKEE